MKKINLKGKLDLNKQTVSRLNSTEQALLMGGKLDAQKTTDSQMTVMHTATCHCDSQMTIMDTASCHCDEKTKTKGC